MRCSIWEEISAKLWGVPIICATDITIVTVFFKKIVCRSMGYWRIKPLERQIVAPGFCLQNFSVDINKNLIER